MDLLEKWNGKSFLPTKARHVVTTDASCLGWGGRMGKKDVQGFWTRAEVKRSSSKRELHTTVLVVQALRKELQGSVVEVHTDNFTTMAYINHQGGRDPDLTEIVCPFVGMGSPNPYHDFRDIYSGCGQRPSGQAQPPQAGQN